MRKKEDGEFCDSTANTNELMGCVEYYRCAKPVSNTEVLKSIEYCIKSENCSK